MLILVGACYDGVFAPRVFWGEGVHLKLLSFLLVSFFFSMVNLERGGGEVKCNCNIKLRDAVRKDGLKRLQKFVARSLMIS